MWWASHQAGGRSHPGLCFCGDTPHPEQRPAVAQGHCPADRRGNAAAGPPDVEDLAPAAGHGRDDLGVAGDAAGHGAGDRQVPGAEQGAAFVAEVVPGHGDDDLGFLAALGRPLGAPGGKPNDLCQRGRDGSPADPGCLGDRPGGGQPAVGLGTGDPQQLRQENRRARMPFRRGQPTILRLARQRQRAGIQRTAILLVRRDRSEQPLITLLPQRCELRPDRRERTLACTAHLF
jgi:hypothetical protein